MQAVRFLTVSLLCAAGGWHRWQPGHAGLRGVLCLLQDDVDAARSVPADAHLQQPQGLPGHRWPETLPGDWTEGRPKAGAEFQLHAFLLAIGNEFPFKRMGTSVLYMWKKDRCLLIFICRLAGLFLESSCSHYLFFSPSGSFGVPLNIISRIAFFFHVFPLSNPISICLLPVFSTLEQSWCSWLCLWPSAQPMMKLWITLSHYLSV